MFSFLVSLASKEYIINIRIYSYDRCLRYKSEIFSQKENLVQSTQTIFFSKGKSSLARKKHCVLFKIHFKNQNLTKINLSLLSVKGSQIKVGAQRSQRRKLVFIILLLPRHVISEDKQGCLISHSKNERYIEDTLSIIRF